MPKRNLKKLNKIRKQTRNSNTNGKIQTQLNSLAKLNNNTTRKIREAPYHFTVPRKDNPSPNQPHIVNDSLGGASYCQDNGGSPL